MDLKTNFIFILILIIVCFQANVISLPIKGSFSLTLIHNNDFHTHYPAINEFSNECKPNQTCFGGIARTVSKVKQIIKESNSEGKNVLNLNAGDHYQGTVWYTFEKWKIVAEFIKHFNHDVMTLGNHEFDDGVDGLLPFVRNVSQKIPFVCCNIEMTGELQQLIKPSVVLEINGTKVAVIGYLTPDTVFLAQPGPSVKFHNEITSVKNEIARLKKEHGSNLNIFIGLGHSGYDRDKEIAQNIPELDVIVGGHSHTLLYSGNKPSIEEIGGPYPTVIKHGDGTQTLVVQAYAFGKYLGKLDLLFDDRGNIVHYDGTPIMLDATVPEDTEVLKLVKEKALIIDEAFNQQIGNSLVNLDALKCREQECNAGNLFADGFVNYFIDRTQNRDKSWTTVAAGVINGGSVRSGIGTGNITRKEIISASPFGNQIGVLKVIGSKLWDIFEHSAGQYKLGGFLQVSGIRYQFDSTKPIGQRLQSLRIKCADCLIPTYEDLVMDKTYNLVISDYLVNGGDNYTINSQDFTPYMLTDYEVVIKYITKFSPVFTGIEDRILNKKSNCSSENLKLGKNSSLGLNSNNNYLIIIFINIFQLFKYFNKF